MLDSSNSLEIELKLCLQPDASLTRFYDLAWLQGLDTQQQFLKTMYFDTSQADFHRHRMALRIRQEGLQFIQTLKKPIQISHDGLQCCTEWQTLLIRPQPDCTLIPDTVLPSGFAQLIKNKPLLEIFNTQFTRQTWLYDSGDTQVEIALDQGLIESYGAFEKIFEMELELKQGSDKQVLYDLASKIRPTIDVLANTDSKAKRGYALAQLQKKSSA